MVGSLEVQPVPLVSQTVEVSWVKYSTHQLVVNPVAWPHLTAGSLTAATEVEAAAVWAAAPGQDTQVTTNYIQEKRFHLYEQKIPHLLSAL